MSMTTTAARLTRRSFLGAGLFCAASMLAACGGQQVSGTASYTGEVSPIAAAPQAVPEQPSASAPPAAPEPSGGAKPQWYNQLNHLGAVGLPPDALKREAANTHLVLQLGVPDRENNPRFACGWFRDDRDLWTALNDATSAAGQRQVLLVTTGGQQCRRQSEADPVEAVRSGGTAVHVVALTPPAADRAQLEEIARVSGGTYREVSGPEQIVQHARGFDLAL